MLCVIKTTAPEDDFWNVLFIPDWIPFLWTHVKFLQNTDNCFSARKKNIHVHRNSEKVRTKRQRTCLFGSRSLRSLKLERKGVSLDYQEAPKRSREPVSAKIPSGWWVSWWLENASPCVRMVTVLLVSQNIFFLALQAVFPFVSCFLCFLQQISDKFGWLLTLMALQGGVRWV